jgi:carboxyl-terminal processing protease
LASALPLVVAWGCGSGGDALPPSSDLAGKCATAQDQKTWVRSYMDEVYLWYRDIPNVDAARYSTPQSYFDALLVRTPTLSGQPRDRFSFTYPTEAWKKFINEGEQVGYGLGWVYGTFPDLWVGFVAPNTPASTAGLQRGDRVLSINGIPLGGASRDLLVAALLPSVAGATVSFTVLRTSGLTLTVAVISAVVATPPVLLDSVLTDGNRTIGYLMFLEQSAAAEPVLVDAFNRFVDAGVQDLVVDLRYNGGGYLAIASEASYEIAGSNVTGKVFEKLQFNDKRTADNADPKWATPFLETTNYSSTGVPLPTLNLSRVYLLTTDATCSASESIANALAPFIEVVRVGTTTCGKPYGFLSRDNCGTTYLPIEFTGVNALGEGNYAEGLAPTCPAQDDLAHPLGDPSEALLRTALTHLRTGQCGSALRAPTGDAALRFLRPPERELRIVVPRDG